MATQISLRDIVQLQIKQEELKAMLADLRNSVGSHLLSGDAAFEKTVIGAFARVLVYVTENGVKKKVPRMCRINRVLVKTDADSVYQLGDQSTSKYLELTYGGKVIPVKLSQVNDTTLTQADLSQWLSTFSQAPSGGGNQQPLPTRGELLKKWMEVKSMRDARNKRAGIPPAPPVPVAVVQEEVEAQPSFTPPPSLSRPAESAGGGAGAPTEEVMFSPPPASGASVPLPPLPASAVVVAAAAPAPPPPPPPPPAKPVLSLPPSQLQPPHLMQQMPQAIPKHPLTLAMEKEKERLAGVETATPAPPIPFIPSATWAGVKPGYYFGSGSCGIGYYVDPAVAAAGCGDAAAAIPGLSGIPAPPPVPALSGAAPPPDAAAAASPGGGRSLKSILAKVASIRASPGSASSPPQSRTPPPGVPPQVPALPYGGSPLPPAVPSLGASPRQPRPRRTLSVIGIENSYEVVSSSASLVPVVQAAPNLSGEDAASPAPDDSSDQEMSESGSSDGGDAPAAQASSGPAANNRAARRAMKQQKHVAQQQQQQRPAESGGAADDSIFNLATRGEMSREAQNYFSQSGSWSSAFADVTLDDRRKTAMAEAAAAAAAGGAAGGTRSTSPAPPAFSTARALSWAVLPAAQKESTLDEARRRVSLMMSQMEAEIAQGEKEVAAMGGVQEAEAKEGGAAPSESGGGVAPELLAARATVEEAEASLAAGREEARCRAEAAASEAEEAKAAYATYVEEMDDGVDAYKEERFQMDAESSITEYEIQAYRDWGRILTNAGNKLGNILDKQGATLKSIQAMMESEAELARILESRNGVIADKCRELKKRKAELTEQRNTRRRVGAES